MKRKLVWKYLRKGGWRAVCESYVNNSFRKCKLSVFCFSPPFVLPVCVHPQPVTVSPILTPPACDLSLNPAPLPLVIGVAAEKYFSWFQSFSLFWLKKDDMKDCVCVCVKVYVYMWVYVYMCVHPCWMPVLEYCCAFKCVCEWERSFILNPDKDEIISQQQRALCANRDQS